MEKVLVLGGSYFIGKKIVEVLLSNKYDVTVLNRGSCLLDNINQLICNRNNVEEMKSTLLGKEFNYVIDVSGLNKKQSEILCESIDSSKLKKIIFISSSAVYDVDNLSIPYAETDNLRENAYWGEYGTNKIEAENCYLSFSKKKNIDVIILRPPYVYGENNYVQRESFIFDHLLNNKPILIPNTNSKIQFIYAKDLANIIVKIIRDDNLKTEIFNVGNREFVTFEEWIIACSKVASIEPVIIKYDYKKHGYSERDFFPFHDYDNVLDVSKIKKIYPEETDFLLGLKEAYNWYLCEKDNIKFKEEVINNEEIINKELVNRVID
ncbi:MAG: NAD-dependent epimerase/dehydratase family protein [Clostridiales bacterium]|nr:NAD-dependent epimerase/dehydratase family protein [Clostridiales bacterium]